MRLALAQFNASVGDIKGNVTKMGDLSIKAFELGADVVIFPELSVCGYPPEDLLLKEQFLNDGYMLKEGHAIYPISYIEALDIDTPEDYKLVKVVYEGI